MRPELEKIDSNSTHSFVKRIVRREQRPHLTEAWHYHPEIEICFTRKSKGKRFVGNNISNYKEGDLVILGSYLPHGFTTIDQSEQYVIQFKKEFLGETFISSNELQEINRFLNLSIKGILIKGEEALKAEDYILDLFRSENSKMKNLLLLLELLDFLANCSNVEYICSEKYSSTLSESKLNNVQAIFNYISENFQNDISIKSASTAVNMTESAFYKFIKRHTNKKFTTILNEYRINHASILLASSNQSIAEVSFKSGYNNLSYFNRIFKQTYRMTPNQFRTSYQNN